jgi:CW-type Zinc Finger
MVSTIESFGDRWKLEAAADILLLYARTTNFFKVVPYTVLESTPIEVYARELGNNIQVKDMTHVKEDKPQRSTNVILVDDLNPVKGFCYVNSNEKKSDEYPSEVIKKRKHEKEFCDPEAVVANVKIKYGGDYVLSQLLQWFNGGIGQKPGLPDMLGCVLLPSVEATLACSSIPGKKNQRASFYTNQIRPQLFDWLSDIHQRGNPFPETLSRLFLGPNLGDSSTPPSVFPIGSPILDLLVMGDDFNINSITDALKRDIQHQGKLDSSKDFATRQLESSIDEAMPAQAVANWVQCENENCLKWRRLPFYVDVDALPEQFYCRDNVWNPNAQSCDALEDTWDEKDNFLQSKGIDAKASPSSKSTRSIGCNDEVIPPSPAYKIGSHHDDLRKDVKQISTGQVVEINENENGKKRLKFHYLKDSNELVECNDNRSQRVSILCIKEPKREVQSVNLIAGGENILIAENMPSKKASLDSTHGQNDVEKAHGSFHEISHVPNPSSIAVTLLSLRQPPQAQGLIRHSLKASNEKLFYDDSLTKQTTSPLEAYRYDSVDKNPTKHRPCINPRRAAAAEANISSLVSKDCIWKEQNSLSDKSLAVKYSVSANHATKDHVPKVPKLAKSPINGDKVLNFQKLQPHVNVPKSNATLMSASEVTKRIPRKATVTSDGGLTLRRSLLEKFDDKKQSTLNSKWSHGTNDKIYQSRIPTPSSKKDGLFHLKKSTGFDQMDQSIEGKHQSMIDRQVFQREQHYRNLENKQGVMFQQSQSSEIEQKLHVVKKSP